MMCSLRDYMNDPTGMMLDHVWRVGHRNGWREGRIRKVQNYLVSRQAKLFVGMEVNWPQRPELR